MSGRARGKHTQREVVITPDSPEGRGLGMSDRRQGTPSPIPGGKVHIVNPETERERPAIKDSRPEIKDLNAHGVPPTSHTAAERAEAMRGNPNDQKAPVPRYAEQVKAPVPVPVYIVERERPTVIRTSAPHHITLQASTGEPVRLCGQDLNRTAIFILNESTSSNARFAQRGSDLVNGGGALLPWPGNSYLKMETQDELWAISADSGTPTISIIQEFEQPW